MTVQMHYKNKEVHKLSDALMKENHKQRFPTHKNPHEARCLRQPQAAVCALKAAARVRCDTSGAPRVLNETAQASFGEEGGKAVCHDQKHLLVQ